MSMASSSEINIVCESGGAGGGRGARGAARGRGGAGGAGSAGASAVNICNERSSRASKKRKVTLFITLGLVFLFLALACSIGATVCAISDSSKHLEFEEYFDGKLIQDSEYSYEGDAYPGYTEPRTAIAVNNGSLPMYARVNYTTYWAESDGAGEWTRSSDESLDPSLIEVNLAADSNWEDGGDGWYYYQAEIAPGEQTSNFLDSVTLSTQIGEEYNDNTNHAVSSIYAGKAAEVDVELQCTAEPVKSDGAGSGAQAAFMPKTGDTLSPLTILLIALAILAALACFIFVILARRRSRDDDDDGQAPCAAGAGAAAAGAGVADAAGGAKPTHLRK